MLFYLTTFEISIQFFIKLSFLCACVEKICGILKCLLTFQSYMKVFPFSNKIPIDFTPLYSFYHFTYKLYHTWLVSLFFYSPTDEFNDSLKFCHRHLSSNNFIHLRTQNWIRVRFLSFQCRKANFINHLLLGSFLFQRPFC